MTTPFNMSSLLNLGSNVPRPMPLPNPNPIPVANKYPSTTSSGPLNLDYGDMILNYQKGLGQPGNNGANMARYLLEHANVDWSKIPQLPQQSSGGGFLDNAQSVLGKVIDLMSRPMYAVDEGIRQLEMPGNGESNINQGLDVAHGILSGLAGTKKTSFSDIQNEISYRNAHDPNAFNELKKSRPDMAQNLPARETDPNYWETPQNPNDIKHPAANVDDPSVSRALGGFVGSVVTDPLSYIGLGEARTGLRALGKFAIKQGANDTGIAGTLANLGVKQGAPMPYGTLSVADNPTQVLNAKATLGTTGNVENLFSGSGGLNIARPTANIPTPPPQPLSTLAQQTLPDALKGVPQPTYTTHAPGSIPGVFENTAGTSPGELASRGISAPLPNNPMGVAANVPEDAIGVSLGPPTASKVTITPPPGAAASAISDPGLLQGATKASIPSGVGANPSIAQLPTDITKGLAENATKGMSKADIVSTIQNIQKSLPADQQMNLKGFNVPQLKSILSDVQEMKGPEAMARSAPSPKFAEQIAKEGQPPIGPAAPVAGSTRGIVNGITDLNLNPTAIGAHAAQIAESQAATSAAEGFIRGNLTKDTTFSKASPEVNPAQQANFFQSRLLAGSDAAAPNILTQTKNIQKPHAFQFQKARFASAYRMLKQAEDHFAARGFTPTFWDGSHLKLSDVIDAAGGPSKVTKELYTQLMTAFKTKSGFEKITNPTVINAIEKVRAADALNQAPKVQGALGAINSHAAIADQILSGGHYNQWLKDATENFTKNDTVAKTALTNTQAMMSPAAQKATSEIMKKVIQQSRTLPQQATINHGSAIQRYIVPTITKNSKNIRSTTTAIKWAPIGKAQTNAIAQQIGAASPRTLGGMMGMLNRAQEFFGGHLTTWYGAKDMRPEALNHIASAMNNANARMQLWNEVAKKYPLEQRQVAFKGAQGRPGMTSADPNLIGQFQKSMEDLFKSTGLTDEANKASSVALRAGMTIDDLNKQLKTVNSDLRFTNAADALDKITGDRVDFSKGTDWLNSWMIHDISNGDPLHLMIKVQTAVEQVMHQYAFMDELAARYGATSRSGPFSELMGSVKSAPTAKGPKAEITGIGRLAGVYFPKEIAPQVHKVMETWNQFYDPKSPLVRFLDRVTSAWKSGVTIYTPSHHIRNFTGDNYMSWLAGVNSPHSYNTAARIIWAHKDHYLGALKDINSLVDKQALDRAMTRPGDTVLVTKKGIALTADQVYIAAHRMGLLTQPKVVEDIYGKSIPIKPLGGYGQKVALTASELNEHYTRLAHFADQLKKITPIATNQGGKDYLPRLFSEAAQEVRKWHPDGLDLTNFERKVLRRVLPFYSWTRKAIPLVIEGAVMNPGKITAVNKAVYSIQQAQGIQSPSIADPFPVDQLFPSWIKAMNYGPTMGSAGGYDVVNPHMEPFHDLVAQFGGMGNQPGHPFLQDTLQGIAGMLNPMARVPVEMAGGNQLATGIPISNDPARYLTEQLPIISDASRLGNMGLGGVTNKGQKNGIPNWPGIINYLTGAGYIPTQPYIKTAQFEQKAAAKARANG